MRVLKSQTGLLFLSLVLFAGSAVAQQASAAHPEMLVSSNWLAEHLKDPNLVILHVAEKKSDFDRGHIPGTRFIIH